MGTPASGSGGLLDRVTGGTAKPAAFIGGALLGGGVGFMLGGIPGAVIGAVAGALVIGPLLSRR